MPDGMAASAVATEAEADAAPSAKPPATFLAAGPNIARHWL